MRLRRVIAILITSVFAALSISPPNLAGKSRSDDNLFRVKTIFLQSKDSTITKEWAVKLLKLLPTELNKALAGYGFKVAADSADADATMGVDVSKWGTLDGPQPYPPKYGFHFLLVSSKYNVE